VTGLELGNALRSLRLKRGLGLRELGRQSGMAAASLSAIENGASSPTFATLHKVLRVLGTDFAEFFATPPDELRVPVFAAKDQRVLADRFRRYVFPFPKRKDIRFEAILETILPTEKRSQWETLDCDMAGIVLAGGPLKLEIRGTGSWTLRRGDAFYVREGQEHHAINASHRPVRLVTIFYPPRY
jgi:transcriptional regulator with XRE-family HTH domain